MDSNKPELYRDSAFSTVEGWIYVLETYGHAAFYVKGNYYWLFPEGSHKYGLCLYENMESTTKWKEWEFNSEIDFLEAKIFAGYAMKDLLHEVLAYDESK